MQRIDLRKVFVGPMVQRALRLDGIDQQAGGGVDHGDHGLKRELLEGLGRLKIVQVESTRSHEFKRAIARQAQIGLAYDGELSRSTIEVAGCKVRSFILLE